MKSSAKFDGIGFRGVYGISWKKFFLDLYHEINEDNIFNGAAALGYYFTLAIFPALISLLSLLPSIPTPDLQVRVFDLINVYLPRDAAGMLIETLNQIVSKNRQGLLSLGALLTLWASSAGVYAIMQQLNITYDVKDSRSFLKARGISILLTLGFGVLTIVAFLMIVLGQVLQDWVEYSLVWSDPLLFAFVVFRWIVIPVCLAFALALIFYYGPDVKQEFKFITPGSILGTVLLVLVSLVFKLYVENFANYNATYGSIGAVIILMLWLNILGLVILLGSEVNALIEHYSPEGKDKGQKSVRAPVEHVHETLPHRNPSRATLDRAEKFVGP